ncbi:MAG TPA: helix-turn-helix domain-containing protein, partial [Mycobacterium sp.]|nr:helix-turn-helix domain-containing protein [Mycobacterium sp.]
RCVAEKGYSATTIREIARAAGMTSGSLYHYFPTKAALLKATLSTIEHTAMPRLRTAAQHGGDVVDRLDAVLDESDRLMREYPHLAAFERAMRSERAAHLRGDDPDRVGFQALRDILDDVIANAQLDGSLSAAADREAAVDVLDALARGLTEQAANLSAEAYHVTLTSAKKLIRGTLFHQGN